MKKLLLMVGICFCGLFGIAKIWGLIFLEFSEKQAGYAVALLAAAYGMFAALREPQSPPDDT